jgi:hypothetical protein
MILFVINRFSQSQYIYPNNFNYPRLASFRVNQCIHWFIIIQLSSYSDQTKNGKDNYHHYTIFVFVNIAEMI